jgi:two-component system, NarL family, nitrate/nitrite response regulator NarL
LKSDTTRSPILLASDFPILRDSLKAYFEKASELNLVACADNQEEVIPLVESSKPKLVLLDLNIDLDDLCRLLDDIHTKSDARSLIMSDDSNNEHVMKVLRHGANGVVPRRTSPELFTKSMTMVLAGHFWVSRAMITDFVHRIRQSAGAEVQKMSLNLAQAEKVGVAARAANANSARVSEAETCGFGLTRRESQIIGALVDGQTNKDIAGTFGISEYTVKHHLTNVYDKLGVYNRVELVLFAMNHGLCGTNGSSAVLPGAM